MTRKLCFVALLALLPLKATAAPSAERVCALAPSQSKTMAALAGAAGGSAGAIAAVAQAAGLSVVAHSSGAAILTGSGGYVAGTLGVAITGPAIVAVGLVVGGIAVTVELVCAPTNHPRQVAKVKAAATEFARRSNVLWGKSLNVVIPSVSGASVAVQRVSGDVLAYAYRRVGSVRKALGT